MKSKKILSFIMVTLLMVTQICGVAYAATSKVTITTPKVEYLTLIIGDTYQLKGKVAPKNKTIKFTSSNSSVVSVTSKGKLTAKKKGTVKITAKASGSKSDTLKVTVTDREKLVSKNYLMNSDMEVSTNTITDNVGTIYKGYLRNYFNYSTKYRANITYLNDKDYTTISGKIILPESNKNTTSAATVSILDESDNVLYISPKIMGGVLPVDFSIDIENTSVIKIEIDGDTNISIVNAYFIK